MTASGRKEPAAPAPHPAPPGTELLFCAVCQVSISAAELTDGDARRTVRGRVFCGICARSTPEERGRRRASLEAEFADDAPVPVPIGAERIVAAAARAAAPADDAAFSTSGPHATSSPDRILEARVGELERAVFRLRARVTWLEERLQESMQRAS